VIFNEDFVNNGIAEKTKTIKCPKSISPFLIIIKILEFSMAKNIRRI